ncbi:Three-deoxy-D-manno-octulosonic-acid transferase protein, partial [human gut metagenome]
TEFATVSNEEKQSLLEEFGFGNNHPIIIAGSTHKGEEETIFETFKQVLQELVYHVLPVREYYGPQFSQENHQQK